MLQYLTLAAVITIIATAVIVAKRERDPLVRNVVYGICTFTGTAVLLAWIVAQ